jgi:uncharacterized protein YkwD
MPRASPCDDAIGMTISLSCRAGNSASKSSISSPKSRPGRLVGILALVVALMTGLPASASAACSGADKATTSTARFSKAMTCLHDSERRSHGMRRHLRLNRALSLAAAKHARDMVRRHYFEHKSPNGNDHMDRIAAGSYKPSTGSWSAGENLLFSRGHSTPRQLFGAWMKSADHRSNILRSCWRDFGLGVVHSSPFGDAGGLTVVALFGKHRGGCR